MTPHLAGRLALETVESLLPAELRGVEGSTRFSGGARLSGGTQLVGARGPALPLFHAAAGAAAGVLRAHIAQGNPAAVLHGTGPDAEIVIHGEGEEMCVATLAEMPVTLGGAAAFNVANVLAAAAMAHAHEVPLAAIQAGIRSFIPSLSTRPVCLNLVQAHGQTVVFDYAQRRIISHFFRMPRSGCARTSRGMQIPMPDPPWRALSGPRDAVSAR